MIANRGPRGAAAGARPVCENRGMPRRQKLLILYLADSSLESNVIAWARYDGTGETLHMSGDSDVPPYPTGLDALLDGWRLFQMSPVRPEAAGAELTTSYLKYEFAFEKWVKVKKPERDAKSKEKEKKRNEKRKGHEEAEPR